MIDSVDQVVDRAKDGESKSSTPAVSIDPAVGFQLITQEVQHGSTKGTRILKDREVADIRQYY
jgi:hypothetical protein